MTLSNQEKYNKLLKRKDKLEHKRMCLEIQHYETDEKLKKVENEIRKYKSE